MSVGASTITHRRRFYGAIAGTGSTSGIRVVVGHWQRSPYGAFGDAMVETADGERLLLAPDHEVADFIAATYHFDTVRVERFHAAVVGDTWAIESPSLTLTLTTGPRTALGWALRSVPQPVAESPAWCTVTDPVARIVMRGVRTRGTAGGRRREWYAATDHHAVLAATGSFDGRDLGQLAPVDPPCRFGFSSVPRRPGVTAVVTTVAPART